MRERVEVDLRGGRERKKRGRGVRGEGLRVIAVVV